MLIYAKRVAAMLAVAGLLGGATTATALASHHHHHHLHKVSAIPQHNGGDHDSDNNGGPSDGDGNI